MRYCCIILFFSINSTLLLGQNSMVGGNLHGGKVMAHTGDISYLVNDGIRALDLQFSWQGDGSRYWHNQYRYPRYGLGFYSTSLGNNQYYGHANAIYSFFNFPFNKKERRLSTQFILGLGIAYHNKIYDAHENVLNVAIGSRFNGLVKLGFEWNYQLTNRIILAAGTNFVHVSNGKIQTPNLGINMLNLYSGMHYRLRDFEKTTQVATSPYRGKHVFQVSIATGLKTPSKFIYKQYPIASLSVDYGWFTSNKRVYGVGGDIFYDRALEYTITSHNHQYLGTKQLFRTGIHGFQDLYIGDLIITVQLGTYLYSRYFEFTNIYTRTGLKYLFTKNMYAKMCLKAHYGNADFIEWGVGYLW